MRAAHTQAGRLFHPWGTSLQALLCERDEIIVGQTMGGWSKGFHSVYLNREISVSVCLSLNLSVPLSIEFGSLEMKGLAKVMPLTPVLKVNKHQVWYTHTFPLPSVVVGLQL